MELRASKTRTTARRWRKGILALLLTGAAAGAAGCFLFMDQGTLIGLWLTPDQQGRRYFERGDYTTAAERFQDPRWKGIALYKAGNFEAAVEQFARVDTPEGSFNLGNAYAHAGHLEQAAASYGEVLRRKPDCREARENRDLVRTLMPKKKGAKKKEHETPQGQEPTYTPDRITFDEKGKKGERGEVAQTELTAAQIEDLWMRRLQTTPADFLRLKFAVQAQETKTAQPRGTSGGESR